MIKYVECHEKSHNETETDITKNSRMKTRANIGTNMEMA